MPLTKSLKKIKKAMEKEYGKKKGKSVFYGWEKKHEELDDIWKYK